MINAVNNEVAILPVELFAVFDEGLKKLEQKNNVVRIDVHHESGNRFGMKGDTFTITYKKQGKWSTFKHKDVREYWNAFAKAYPKTNWKGK